MNFFEGLLIMGVAYLMVRYRAAIYGFFGSFEWLEQKLGQGSTISFIAIMGVVVFFFGLLHMTGSTGAVVQKIFGPIFGVGVGPA